MYLIYGIIIFIVIIALYVLLKAAEFVSGLGVVMAVGGVGLLVLFLLVHCALAYHDKKDEGGGIGETLHEAITLFCMNFPLIGFFLTYLGPAALSNEDADIFGMISFVLWTVIALMAHLGLWYATVIVACELSDIRGLAPVCWIVSVAVTLMMDNVLTLGALFETYASWLPWLRI